MLTKEDVTIDITIKVVYFKCSKESYNKYIYEERRCV